MNEQVIKAAIDIALPWVKNEEGYRYNAYKNGLTEPWTVGYGFTYDEQGRPFAKESTMDKVRAEKFLIVQIRKRVDEILNDLSQTVQNKLNPNQLAALISFHFNLGDNQYRGSSVVRLLNEGRWDEADDAFLLWKRGNTANDLLPRRKREQALFNKPWIETVVEDAKPSLNDRIKEQLEIIDKASAEIKRLLG